MGWKRFLSGSSGSDFGGPVAGSLGFRTGRCWGAPGISIVPERGEPDEGDPGEFQEPIHFHTQQPGSEEDIDMVERDGANDDKGEQKRQSGAQEKIGGT